MRVRVLNCILTVGLAVVGLRGFVSLVLNLDTFGGKAVFELAGVRPVKGVRSGWGGLLVPTYIYTRARDQAALGRGRYLVPKSP